MGDFVVIEVLLVVILNIDIFMVNLLIVIMMSVVCNLMVEIVMLD